MHPGRHNFHAVWPSLFATSMGLMAFLPVLALYVQERFAIDDPAELAVWAGTIYGVAPLCAAVVGPLWGGLGDRIGKKPMAIRANLAIAATTALMPLASTPLVLLAMRAVQGVLAGYVAPAMALAAEEAPRGEHGVLIARLQVAMAGGSFLGPFVGAVASHLAGRAALFWLTSALSAGAALWLHWRAREVPVVHEPSAFLRAFVHASRELLGNRVFAWLLVLVLALRLGQNMLEPFVVLFVRDLGPQPWLLALCPTTDLALDLAAGTAFAVLAVAQLAFTTRWGRLADRFGPLRCLGALGLVLSVVLAATAAVATLDQFLLLRSLAACVMAGSMALAYAAASKRVDDRHRTLAFSLVQSCMQLGFALGPMLGAVCAIGGPGEPANYRRPFLVAAALCALAGAGMLWLRRLTTRRGAAL
ncbi:MAG: MFS transporter [Planctomycetes bacterium]|nr:MFS transporter [Planctomycetota bacterium]